MRRLDMAGNVYEWTADGAVRGGSYLSGPTSCAARRACRCIQRRATPTSASASSPSSRDGFDWVDVPAGDYVIGRDADESRQRVVDVDAFELARTPVTNAQYERFVAETGAAAHWPAPSEHPVTFVDWARRPRSAAGPVGGCRQRPSGRRPRGEPTGARPWGDEEDEGRASVGRGLKHGSTSPVGSHPDGASLHGLLDMAGNVWEWTSTEYPPGERVLRGGSFASPGLAWARCTMRSHSRPTGEAHIGFASRERHERRHGSPAGPALELVEVESPTGDTAEVARLYGSVLEGIGMEVELLDERFPNDRRRAASG